MKNRKDQWMVELTFPTTCRREFEEKFEEANFGQYSAEESFAKFQCRSLDEGTKKYDELIAIAESLECEGQLGIYLRVETTFN